MTAEDHLLNNGVKKGEHGFILYDMVKTYGGAIDIISIMNSFAEVHNKTKIGTVSDEEINENIGKINNYLKGTDRSTEFGDACYIALDALTKLLNK